MLDITIVPSAGNLCKMLEIELANVQNSSPVSLSLYRYKGTFSVLQ
jgi:hypothetical protein